VTGEREAALRAWLARRDEASREACLLAWLGLVKRVWQRLRVSLPPAADQVADDLMQCGVMGLMQAVESYQPQGGAGFETWAKLRVRGAMLDELRRMDWISKERRRRWKQLQRSVQELQQRLQRACSERELAAHLGLSVEALRESLQENAPGSIIFLDALQDEMGLSLHERLADARQAGPDRASLDRELSARLAGAIQALAEQERTLLALILEEELGHKEAAAVMGVSPGRVSQIYAKAVLHLQAALASDLGI
jgi:RNA polymerase sigma factor for flagellar operon FliA